jgi:glc operon protein GlcG
MTSTPANPPSLQYGPSLSLEAARRVMQAAEGEALAHGWPVVIAIVDASAQLLMLHRLDQAQLGSIAIAQQKAEAAAKFRRATKVYDDMLAGGGAALRLLTLAGMCAVEGGLPLVVGGRVAGAIGVSGVRSGEDAQIAAAGARALEGA